LRVEEFAGHDVAGERYGASPYEDADESKSGTDDEERGDFSAAKAGADANAGERREMAE
jgi:hypothetical protein